ncbi:MAG: DsbA family protein [Immundisolibacter sp.]
MFGVPSFVVGEEVFWGNDRLDFLAEHLTELGAARASSRA